MLIDPQGLFYGERIAACSDEARLHFPWLMAASNGFGRIEMSVAKLHATVYAKFAVKPTREQLQKWFREYHENYLLFVYVAPLGGVWGQWAVSKGKLPKWKTAEDKRSPAPLESEFQAYLVRYAEAKKARYEQMHDHIAISEDFKSLPKASEDFRSLPRGEVEVEVVGEVEEFASQDATPVPSPAESAASELAGKIRLAILDYWSRYVQPNAEPTWDGSEQAAVRDLVRATPKLTIERVRLMLRHRGESDVNPSERPRKWVRSLPDYELGPLDAFGKPRGLAQRSRVGASTPRAPDAQETASRLQREASDRAEIVDYWRKVRDDDPATYYGEAPEWVRRLIEGERAVA